MASSATWFIMEAVPGALSWATFRLKALGTLGPESFSAMRPNAKERPAQVESCLLLCKGIELSVVRYTAKDSVLPVPGTEQGGRH